ncbi:AlpA family phage regulatory protein [Methylococcus sp. ANG]|uniref:helix-turn-helix transcriptional regulator n=1 Tax=Methylococcus sp. ANG TaxID=3231903 RepID=UPI003458CF52
MAEKSISQIRPRIVRPADAARLSGIPRSSLYWRINRGTFPPAVKLGPRSSGFLLDEVEAVIDAHVAGRSIDEIKALVRQIVAERGVA